MRYLIISKTKQLLVAPVATPDDPVAVFYSIADAAEYVAWKESHDKAQG